MWLKRRAPKPVTLTAADARPVCYGGVSMRSTLEARWACWFSHVGIRWEYERESVRVDGRPRWPDYWLPDQALWVEVKPEHTPADEHLALSIAERTGSGLLWLAGNPWPGSYRVTYFPAATLSPIRNLRWAVGRRDPSEIWLCDPGAMLSIRLSPQLTGAMTWEAAQGMEFPLFDCHSLRQSYSIASGFRFEEVGR